MKFGLKREMVDQGVLRWAFTETSMIDLDSANSLRSHRSSIVQFT